MGIKEHFKQQNIVLDNWLDRLLPSAQDPPTLIHEAMRYSVFAGGKRLRPVLIIAAGEVFNAPEYELLPVACALEMLHTYTLIHDDLPAMDNDILRRGRPTSHVVYGEAMAILAGDALLTQAFQTLSNYKTDNTDRKIRVISEVAKAAGTVNGVIGGQVMDVQFEGKAIDASQLEEIHRLKSGAIICCAVRIGAIIGGASETELMALTEYSEKAGIAFQVIDDVLDVTATSEELGKTPGKDVAAQKATYTALHGVDGAIKLANQLCEESINALETIDRPTELLAEIARFIVERRS